MPVFLSATRAQSRRSRRSLCSDVVAVATPFRVRVALLNAARQTVSLRIRRLAEEEAAYVSQRGCVLFLLLLFVLVPHQATVGPSST